MHKANKIQYRLRNVQEEKIDKLYQNISFPCVDCMHDCKNCVNDIEDCKNREIRENINELVDMIRDEKVNLIRFCEDYNLKLNILLDMLRAKQILSFKYYKCLAHRMHLSGYDEYEKYKHLFDDDKIENNISECEVME